MNKNNVPTITLLIFIWLIGFATTIISLYCRIGIVAILGISAPYYLTKFLLVKEEDIAEE